ncbi:1-deoxy-D-xylulose-5-phosphate reductoisomerase [Castellaniella caeni]|uniref:1-deoxy-D-xylulose-5-phosphate reductoisomerase n=1 Tax=Castellaniella caeni TaxID=266123 RepID=UPI000831AD98|nr:1-deoxy-D-xylulose-5-phosphate reductoisomerase [Castellaniella caeni]
MPAVHRLCILGSTGSIGVSTLDVVARHPDRLSVHALSAHSRIEALAAQALRHRPRVVVVPDAAARARFLAAWPTGTPRPEVRLGAQALADTAADPEVTAVMAAIVGAAGLPGALAAARAGKRVLLANKEALVAAGGLFMQAVRDSGAELLPIDSEHNAIFQCLPWAADRARAPAQPAPGVRRLLLTASGGPFRRTALDELEFVTPDQACAHPNWRMGRKISVDSATMLNKGLEVIEAHWLFAMPIDRIQVVIHPQSVVHSMVEYVDGSILAQLGQPDMRTPIAYGLGYPERLASGVGLLDLARLGHLDFETPDLVRFPCLRLSLNALGHGQSACIALNAANEVAVEGFLKGRIRYTQIAAVIERCLDEAAGRYAQVPGSLDEVLDLDSRTRTLAAGFCQAAA